MGAASAAVALSVVGAAVKGGGTGAGSVSMVRRLPFSTRMTPATTITLTEAGGMAAVKTVTIGVL